jgi:hypothetical protein
VPLIIFILVAGATLVLPRFDIQIGTSASGLVGLTVFYLATSSSAGPVGYLTVWDMSIVLGFLAVGAVLMCGIIGLYRQEREDFEGDDGPALSARLRHRFMAVYAAVVVLGIVAIAITALST